uniref:Selenoprotein H n=1 Tax=Coturnix japonica TaxID=93934 RepID=A0A8C2U417_COTJA
MAPRGRKRGVRRPAQPGNEADPAEKRPRTDAQGDTDGAAGDAVGPRVVIEHCEALRGAVSALAVEINPRQPRRNSFEVSLVKEDGSSEYGLWSGIGKGPPRKLKFPEPEVVVEALRSSLA